MRDYLDEYIVATRLIFRPQGTTIDELSQALNKTERAVYNILAQLEEMNFPIWDEQDPENPKKKRYHANGKFAEYFPNLDFTESDKAVFNYLISNSNNTPGMETQARHLFTKLKLMAAEHGSLIEIGNRKSPSIISSSTITKKIDNKQASKITNAILDAISNKEWINFEYYNMITTHVYKIKAYPIVLFTHQGDYYLYTLNGKEQLRMFAMERIKGILSTEKDKIPTNLPDIKALLEDPFGIIIDTEPFKVKLEIDSEESLYLKQKQWPDSVHITENDDGSILFETTTHSYYDCKTWILKATPHVKILEPDWLKEDILDTLQAGIEMME